MMSEGSLPGSFHSVPMADKSVYEQALTLLEYRARTVDELRRKLRQKGGEAEEIEEVLRRLLDQKLLDDSDFARQFARSKSTTGGASRRRILTELARKGVAREVADAAVSDLSESEGIDLSASIHRVAEKKWRTLRSLDDRTARQRLYGFLARRGFDPDEIRAAMARLDGAGELDER